MSLEDKITALTAAVEALTATMAGAKVSAPVAVAQPEDANKPARAGRAGKAADKAEPATEKPAPAATEPSGGLTAEELTRAIVRAVGATDKDTVLGILKKEFGVSAGKEITDPAVRKEVADRLAQLFEADLG
jgi:hypothetical protein